MRTVVGRVGWSSGLVSESLGIIGVGGKYWDKQGRQRPVHITLIGVSKYQKSKITTNSSNSTTPCMCQYFSPHPSTSRTPLVIQARALKGTSYFYSKDSIGYQCILGFFRKRLSRNTGVTIMKGSRHTQCDARAGSNYQYDAGIGLLKLSCYQQTNKSSVLVGLVFGLLWKDPDNAPCRYPFRTRSRTTRPPVSRKLSLLSLLSLSQL